jgi:hypothetical protein
MERALIVVWLFASSSLQGLSAHNLSDSSEGITVLPLQRILHDGVADYTVDVEFGSLDKSQMIKLVVDTGSSVLIVAASSNVSGSADHYRGECDGVDVLLLDYYGAGTMGGSVCNIPPRSRVKLGGLSAGKPPFMGVKEWIPRQGLLAKPPIFSGASRGILGMAYLGLSGLIDPGFAANNVTPLFDSIVRDNDVPNVFGLQCCGSNGGRMTLGGTDPALYSGELAYTPITCSTVFCVNITRVGTSISGMMPVAFQGSPVDYFFQPGTYVDSRNPYLTLPMDAYTNVSAVINQHAASAGIGNSSVPAFGPPGICGTFEPCACVTQANLTHFPEIWLELLGGVVLKVPPSKYFRPQAGSACMASSVSDNVFGGILGLPTFETYFTAFDKDNSRIGFAPLAGC